MSLVLRNFRLENDEYSLFMKIAKKQNQSTVSIIRSFIKQYNSDNKNLLKNGKSGSKK